ncbi:carbon-nitrogen hydrolase family protein [Acidianus sulfidivorans JP7]|uniref:Carbon-nitrogen hydrolase family protein n=1 Tax=Acidianus sulfidivorans JP7 TaxID=619593 RepID=A0A2U9IK78_9CREN|nr:carbon-nitrogen hydrolase family protein [Acidianus sulfidivorans]AWR96452.1 carbon-nitrogen hydrolase family protein [Acidianus sulfidivorans JP7]
MKIAIVQPSNAKKALELTEKSLKEGAQLVLLPEKWVNSLDEMPIQDFQRLAVKYTSYIIPGAVEDGVSIVSPIIDSKGNIRGIAKKIHLYGKEKGKLLPGDKAILFSFGGIKFGVSICYDADFPEVIRNMAIKGMEILLVPSKIDLRGINLWREYLRVRSLENRIAVVNANAYNPPNYLGNSIAIVPVKNGDIVDLMNVAELGEEENYAIAEINPLDYFNLRIERLKEIINFSVEEI